MLTNELVGGATAFSDPAVLQGGQRFYRGRTVLLHEITPSEVTLFAGDSILFRVNEASPGTARIFKVNGVTNGHAALGTLEPHPADPAVTAAAPEVWRAVQRKSVRRSVENVRYQSYKLRSWQMPGISATLAPFQNTGTGQRVGDFALIPNQTILPVTVTAGATVSRANENATARALVTTPGYEVILRQGTLMKPLNHP